MKMYLNPNLQNINCSLATLYGSLPLPSMKKNCHTSIAILSQDQKLKIQGECVSLSQYHKVRKLLVEP